nr:importin-5-like isoform X1 [Ipomoea batatas]
MKVAVATKGLSSGNVDQLSGVSRPVAISSGYEQRWRDNATTLGDNRIGIKTIVLEEKATTYNMLCCYADELKEGFNSWIDQVAPTIVPLLKFYFQEEVRKAAVSGESSFPLKFSDRELKLYLWSVVNGFQAELGNQLDYLSKTMATSISRQIEQLHYVENFCHSFLDLHEKPEKINSLRVWFSSTESMGIYDVAERLQACNLAKLVFDEAI